MKFTTIAVIIWGIFVYKGISYFMNIENERYLQAVECVDWYTSNGFPRSDISMNIEEGTCKLIK